jgi:hypothetical protein
MEWDEAMAWCAAKGGRLPLVNGVYSLHISDREGFSLDGIDSRDKWDKTRLPRVRHWTGTERSYRETERGQEAQAYAARPWESPNITRGVAIEPFPKRSSFGVVCVPLSQR